MLWAIQGKVDGTITKFAIDFDFNKPWSTLKCK